MLIGGIAGLPKIVGLPGDGEKAPPGCGPNWLPELPNPAPDAVTTGPTTMTPAAIKP
jgi:hypothetical protein